MAVSPASLSTLTPDTQERVQTLMAQADAAGLPLTIVSVRRSCADQNAKWEQGRSLPGSIITNARGCQSWHVLGRAVDFTFLKGSGKGSRADYAAVGAMAKDLGFLWGGDFKGLDDPGHVEYHPGLTINDVCPDPAQCMDGTSPNLPDNAPPPLPVVAGQPGPWFDSGCGVGPQVRLYADGHIEVEGSGFPKQSISPWRKTSPPGGVVYWKKQIYAAAEKYRMPAHVIAGVMKLESDGDPVIVSPTNDVGLMQINMPSHKQYSKTQLEDPATNIDIGTALLRKLYDQYNGNLIKVFFAYNAGSAKCVDDSGCQGNRWGLLSYCNSGKRVDYAGAVIAFANEALDTEFPPYNPTNGDPGAKPPVFGVIPSPTLGVGTILLGAAFGIAAGTAVAYAQHAPRR